MAGSSVSVLILAAHPGLQLVDDVLSQGTCKHILRRGASQPYVTAALLEVGEKAIINHWLLAVQKVPRLQPLAEKVFIICNEDNLKEFTTWASNPSRAHGGFPTSNIISNGRSAADYAGSLADIAAFTDRTGITQDHLLIIDADTLPGPDTNLQRLVEHSIVRGQDMVTSFVPAAGVDLTGQIGVGVSDPDAVSPDVTCLEVGMSGVSDGAYSGILGPVQFLISSTAAAAAAASASGSSSIPGYLEVGAFLSARLAQYPVFSEPLDVVIQVRSLVGFAAAERFLDYNQAELRRASRPANASKAALQQVTAAYTRMTTGRDAFPANTGTLNGTKGPPPLRAQYESFMSTFDPAAALKATDKLNSSLPTRFQDPSTWKHKPHTQHAVYTTSSNDYGKYLPGAAEMPPVWAGTKGQFTKEFRGPPRPTSLVTSTTTSKVHKALDDY